MPDYLPHYQEAGYHQLKIGEEGILDLASFDIASGEFKDLRHRVNRLTREGIETHFLRPPIEDTPVLEVLRLFLNPLVLIFLGAAIVSARMGERVSAGIIIAIVLLRVMN